jgi:hypothetical protein
MLGLVSVAYVILSFHYARSLAHALGRSRNEPRDADQPEYAAWWEENHAFNKKARAQIERERENKPGALPNGGKGEGVDKPHPPDLGSSTRGKGRGRFHHHPYSLCA